MAAQNQLVSPVVYQCDIPAFPPVVLSADAPPFVPRNADGWPCHSSDAEKQFSRCAAKLRALRATAGGQEQKEELNLLFDHLLAENYNQSASPDISIQSQDVCALLKNASCLVPLSQEHLVIKFCQLVHHLLNQLKVILDELTLTALMNYVVQALKVCSTWTHPDVLQALSSVVYGNGSQCIQQLTGFLAEDGILLLYSSPSQPDVELRRISLACMASICLRTPGQPPLDDRYRSVFFKVFLKTLQSPQPPNTDELFYCKLIQAALKGLQCCVFGGKWKFGGEEELGSVLAVLKRLMFHGGPAITVDWPAVLYPAPLPQYEGLSPSNPPEPAKPSEPQAEAAVPSKVSGKNKKRKSRGKGKKMGTVESRGEDGGEDEREAVPILQKGEGRGRREGCRNEGESLSKSSVTSFYPSWKQSSSDSEISDQENTAQSKLRYYHGRVRQGALQCLLAVLKSVEKRTVYGYWSSFIPESPVGGLPPLTLLTVILKDPSPKVRACAIQVVSAMLEGSRQFLAVAEDMSSPRTSFTSLSFSLATSIRELHRTLSLALLAETSAQTLTQVIKCLAYLLANAPYHRLRPGLLSTLCKQLSPYVYHKDANVRVSVLTLYGAMLKNQAPLPEVQRLLLQPEGSNNDAGSFTQQNSALPWRQRGAVSLPSHTPVVPSQRQVPHTPGEADTAPLWLMQLCVSLVTEPREEQSYSDGGETGRVVLEPSPVRVEALQVLSNLVCGYYSLVQPHLSEIVQLSARCLVDADHSVQLHGSKLLEEFGTGIIQQYKADNVPETSRVPISKVVQLWSDVLSGPLNGALQNEQHPKLQSSACDVLSRILPEAFAQLPDKTQLMCITVLLGLIYSENYMVRTAAVRALGVYIQFPCLREDVMLIADTANTILTAFDDRSPAVRASAYWSLGHLTDTLVINMEKMGVDFQEEISDMLLLKMLQAATRASAVNDRVKCYTVRALGNLLYFLRVSQLTRSVFQRPVEDAVRTLVKSVQSETIMKVRWNACYAFGNAFKNPALLQDSLASWICDAFSALCHGVTSHAVFKVRIGSAAALAKPPHRGCYGDTTRFSCVWRSLAIGLEKSEDTNDFLEYRYSASLRHTLSHALLHLLSLGDLQDMPALGASLIGEEGSSIRDNLIKYLREEEVVEKDKDGRGDTSNPQQRIRGLQQTLIRLKGLKGDTVDQGAEEKGREVVVEFLEDLLKNSEES